MVRILRVQAGDIPTQGVLLVLALLKRAQRAHQEIEIVVAGLGAAVRPVHAVVPAKRVHAVGLIGI